MNKRRRLLHIELADQPATPAAVRELAGVVERMVGDLAEDVTLQVHNFTTHVEVVARSEEAEEFVKFVERTLTEPVETRKEDPERARRVMGVFGSTPKSLGVVSVRRKYGRRPIWRGTPAEKRQLRRLAAQTDAEPKAPTNLPTMVTVSSRVLRFGRANESSAHQARVVVDGELVDLEIGGDALDAASEAVKTGRRCRIRMVAPSKLLADLELSTDRKQGKILSIEPEEDLLDPEDFQAKVRAAGFGPGDLFDE